MELGLLRDLTWVVLLACGVLLICYRLHLPSVVGFFVTGILVGPHGMGLVSASHEVEVLAEIGVVALLFAVGIECSLNTLWRIRRTVLMGGSLQMGGTALIVGAACMLLGLPLGQSFFFGLLAAVSSTVIVLRLLQERGRMDAPMGRNSLGILIFQDLAVVPVILLLPLLAGKDVSAGEQVLLVAKAVLIVAATLITARKFIPWLLYRVVRTRSRELFLLTIVALCAGITMLTAASGLSLALGAFLAGLVVSESEYSHEAMGNIQPLRDVFAFFFFVFVGMLLDPWIFLERPAAVLFATLGLMAIKVGAAAFAVRMTGYPLSVALPTGMMLAQVGEFGFVVLTAATPLGLVSESQASLVVAVAVLSMALSPFLALVADRMETLLPAAEAEEGAADTVAGLKDHLVIVGFGLCGRQIADAARQSGVAFCVIEVNPETVRRLREKGEQVIFGDAGQSAILEHAHIESASALVVAVNDPVAIRRATVTARRMHPGLHIVVRTSYVAEMAELYELGADEVIPEEFETSVEIVSRLLNHYHVPREDIAAFVAEIRKDGYAMFRGEIFEAACSRIACKVPDADIATIRLPQSSPLCGKNLVENAIRERYGVSVLAIDRDGEMLPNPSPLRVLAAGDRLHIFGRRGDIAVFTALVADAGTETAKKILVSA
jgi:CPA2 family monovalent cation:H+ antiporter-2